MKEWRIHYREPGIRGDHSESFETRGDALTFMAKTIASGGSIKNIQQKGRSVLAAAVFALLTDARLRVVPCEIPPS
jgi:hypothetical protein